MSNVIALTAKRRLPPAPSTTGEQARILLFTGIRYIRDEADMPAAPSVSLPVVEDRLQA